VGIPVGRTEPGEGGHHVDFLGRVGGLGQRLGLGRGGDDLETVAQPLHGGPGDEDRALQGVGRLAADPIGDGRQQPVLRGDRFTARVHQGEAARAVGRLHHARLKAGLADGRRLLVARHTGDRQGPAEQLGGRRAELGVVVAHLGQQRLRHTEELQKLRAPALLVNVVEQGARGVGRVGGVDRAAG
jgi:hypothetical protein